MKIGSIKPEIIALREFFKEEAPYLRIPSIQRQFVWDAEDIKELIDSIISGYPIGAIIIWEPNAKFPSTPLIGQENNGKTPKYVLDGQQRLTALMLIKNRWELIRGTKTIRTAPISFVPENEKLYISAKKGIDVSLIVNASLAEPEAITELQKNFPTLYKKAMDTIGEKIVNYKLPFYVLKSDIPSDSEEKVYEKVYEKVAEIFTRVNSSGVKIGNLEMFLSFFAATFPKEEKEKIIAMHEEFSESFELDLEPIVRFVFSKMGLKQNQITKVPLFKKAIEKLKEEYSKERHKIGKIIDSAYRSIKIVINMLDIELGISTTQYIPSQNVLLPLFDYIYNKSYKNIDEVPKSEKNKMFKWLLIASFNGIYSSSPNNKIESDLEIVRKDIDSFPLDKLLNIMKERTGFNAIQKKDVIKNINVLRGRTGKEYLMLLDVLLYRNKATDWAGKILKSEDAAIHHIFTRELLRENGETRDDVINWLANLTLIAPSVNSEIGDQQPVGYLSQYNQEILEQHFIPLNQKLWEINNYESFFEERAKLIWKATRNLLEMLG